MAIAFVQKVTLAGAARVNVNTSALTLNGVTAGNFLALLVSVYVGSAPTNITPTDDKGNTWNTTTGPTSPSNESNAFLCYAMNVASGNTIVTFDYGTGYYIEAVLAEFSGIVTTGALDQQTQNSAVSTTPTTGNTGSTAQADELVLAVVGVSISAADVGLDAATTGYTNLHVHQDSLETQGHSSDYKIISSTGVQSAAWGTLDTTSNWAAKIATFKAAAGGGSESRTPPVGSGALSGVAPRNDRGLFPRTTVKL